MWTCACRAGVYAETGRLEDALSLCQKCFPVLSAIAGQSHEVTIQTVRMMTSILASTGRFNEAERLLTDHERSLADSTSHAAGVILAHVAEFYKYTGQHHKAIYAHQTTIRVLLQSSVLDHVFMSEIHNSLGELFQAVGDDGTASMEFAQSVDTWNTSCQGDHPASLPSLLNLEGCIRLQGRTIEADTVHETAVRIHFAALSADDEHCNLEGRTSEC